MKTQHQFPKLIVCGACLLLLLTLGAWGAADKPSVAQVRALLQSLGGAEWKPEQVEIKKITPGFNNGGVIVEAQLETAFRFEKPKRGDWRIAEIRLGDRQWESLELVAEAVRREKVRRTNLTLQEMANALEAYKNARGQYVIADTAVALLDQLVPQYYGTAQRRDLWEGEWQYRGTATEYRLSSPGPDRKPGTPDDLVVENGALRATPE
jgi:hypothetical protein